jgi:hypothetical protein
VVGVMERSLCEGGGLINNFFLDVRKILIRLQLGCGGESAAKY